MELSKSIVSEMGNPYSICYGIMSGKRVIAAGSELMGGEFNLYTGDEWKPVPIIEGIGGVMAIVLIAISGIPTIITAEGLHPNFYLPMAFR